jgi:putative ABC transport system permease protein
MNQPLRDLYLAARSLRKDPIFTVVAVLTIALGIGASTAIFSVVNAVLLRPLPYTQPERLAIIVHDMVARDLPDMPLAPPDLRDIRQQASLFDDVAGVFTFRTAISGDEGVPEQIRAAGVTPNLLRLLGARVVLGRDFHDDDALVPAAPADNAAAPPAGNVAAPPPPFAGILSYGFWQRRYGGDASVLGRTIEFGAQRLEIVGVLAPGVELLFPPGTDVERTPDIWTAARIDYDAPNARLNLQLRAIGRLAPGTSLTAAEAQLERIAADIRQEHVIKEAAGMRFRVVPMHHNLVAGVRPALVALMGAVLFVLLIACANVANLLLVRAAARERELAVRSALGGSRSRLAMQVFTESVLLAAIGALVGIGLAFLGIRLLLALRPADLPRVDAIGVDPMVLGFTATATALAAVLFGLVPAIRASQADVAGMLREAGRTTGLAGGGRTLRNGAVIAAVGLCFVLLVGSGLMLRSFDALQNIDPGFDAENVLTFTAAPAVAGDARARFNREMLDRIGALPGVQSVTVAAPLPLDGRLINARWGPAGAAEDPALFQQANAHFVVPGYFETMRSRVTAGRSFTEAENVRESQAVMIDDVLARKAFGTPLDAVGQQLFMRIRGPEAEWFDIIGVVAHQRHASLAVEAREAVFLTNGQIGHGIANAWAVRTAGDPLALAPMVRTVLADIDPLVPMSDVQPMTALLQRAMAPTRFVLAMIAVFAIIAVFLAAIGLYGVLATSVRHRTAEIGVRLAFGAPPASIQRLFVGEGLRLAAFGVVLGGIAALLLSRVLTTLLVGVEPTDPLTYGAMVLLFFAIAAAASWIPARRASRLSPASALNPESSP